MTQFLDSGQSTRESVRSLRNGDSVIDFCGKILVFNEILRAGDDAIKVKTQAINTFQNVMLLQAIAELAFNNIW